MLALVLPFPLGLWRSRAHLQDLQLLETLLYQLLDLARILHVLVLSESISRSALGVLAEVVGGKLIALP